MYGKVYNILLHLFKKVDNYYFYFCSTFSKSGKGG